MQIRRNSLGPRTRSPARRLLPPAEQLLVRFITFAVYDAEPVLVQYLQLNCTIYIWTDGGKRELCGGWH